MGEIKLCTSGYSFKSWKGTAYPSNIKDKDMLAYYVNNFRLDTLEINYTYYRLPSQKGIASMVKQTPADFVFTVKLFGGITHEPWKSFPPLSVDKSLCNSFIDGIKPLIDSGKLGCVLAQFPDNLQISAAVWDYLLSLPQHLPNIPLVYEFRHKRWANEAIVNKLKSADIGLCVVDEPQIASLMPVYPAVTSDIAYLRFHGRNTNWYNNGDHRYDYLYSDTELQRFLPIIDSLQSESRTLYIAFNNCHAGSAVTNLKSLRKLLDMEPVPIKTSLFD